MAHGPFALVLLPPATMLGSHLGIGRRLLQLCELFALHLLSALQVLFGARLTILQRSELTADAGVVLCLLQQIRGSCNAGLRALTFRSTLSARSFQRRLVLSSSLIVYQRSAVDVLLGLIQLYGIALGRVLALLLQGLQRVLPHRRSVAHFRSRGDLLAPRKPGLASTRPIIRNLFRSPLPASARATPARCVPEGQTVHSGTKSPTRRRQRPPPTWW